MKHRAIVIRECQTKTARAKKLRRGEKGLFKDTGEWMLRTVADMTEKCALKHRKPCMHIETVMLTDEKIEALNCSDWYTAMEELIVDVERGNGGSA